MNFSYYCAAIVGCIFGVAMSIIFMITIQVEPGGSKSYLRILQRIILPTPFAHKTLISSSLASSVWCIDKGTATNLCRFENLYYLPLFKHNTVFLLNEHSVISGIDSSENLKNIRISSVKNHTGFSLKLLIVRDSNFILKQAITLVERDTIFLKRFKPDNIMHVIHDDLLPLFLTYQDLCVGDIDLCQRKYQLVFLDKNFKGPFFDWYRSFSKHNPIFLSEENGGLCFKNCLVGLSDKSVWFQYGFKTNQGPLPRSNLNGIQLSQFTEFIKKEFNIENSSLYNNEETISIPRTAVFFNRKVNRKILNEKEVINSVKYSYKNIYNVNLDVISLDLSTNDSKSIISAIENTNILLGMHGSAMILAIFLPPESIIIELFPFGIQPDVVSPVKALCALSQVSLNYFHWVNNDESKSITHPEYPALLGGISHLQLSHQEKIKEVKLVPPVACCHDPAYLYRMFQDTVVDKTFFDLVSLIFSTAKEPNGLVQDSNLKDWNVYYFPPPVFEIQCKCANNFLEINWSFPFNSSATKVKFSLAADTGFSVTTEDNFYLFETVSCPVSSVDSKGNNYKPVSVWIKTIEDEKESVDSYHLCSL